MLFIWYNVATLNRGGRFMNNDMDYQYNSLFDDAEMIKIEKIEDEKINEIANKGVETYQRLYAGVCVFATLGVGSCAMLEGLSWYHQAGLAIPGITLLYNAWKAKKEEPVAFECEKDATSQVEELEIISSDIINDEKTNGLVEFGTRVWQATKIVAALTSAVLVGHVVSTVDLNAVSSFQTMGLLAAELANISLLAQNNPFNNNVSQNEKTLTKGSK